ncbi:MAG: ATP-binding protein, partial [Dehalococcoidia bacterium]|nr:ATP-binding protein [Dehalococcoidia bacterium]
RDWLLDAVLDDINPVSRKLERSSLSRLGSALRNVALMDFVAMQHIMQLTDAILLSSLSQPQGVRPLPGRDPAPARTRTKRRLAAAQWPEGVLPIVAAHYRRGLGDFGRFRAFRWTGSGLEGIAQPDPVRLSDLVGYEREREPVIRNTRQFLAGRPANDVLIAGARGVGKSSTVKALLNEFARRGLRLVEVAKERLGDLPAVMATLRDRPERFILFVDDLSFEADEPGFKAVKSLLQGSIERRPANVVIYATSNRRNLIAERWRDRRALEDDEVHPRERLDEALSLSDRFGVRVTFPSPSQERYLQIVEALATSAQITMPREQLRHAALQWELAHNGRSGRAAQQFVTWLQGASRG